MADAGGQRTSSAAGRPERSPISWRNVMQRGQPTTASAGRYYPDVPRSAGLAGRAGGATAGRAPPAPSPSANQALAVDPGYHPRAQTVGRHPVHQEGDPAAAADHLTLALGANPNDGEAQNAMGNAMAGLGRTAEAEARYREAIRLMPDQPVALPEPGRPATVAQTSAWTRPPAPAARRWRWRPTSQAVHYALGTRADAPGQEGRGRRRVRHRAARRPRPPGRAPRHGRPPDLRRPAGVGANRAVTAAAQGTNNPSSGLYRRTQGRRATNNGYGLAADDDEDDPPSLCELRRTGGDSDGGSAAPP